MYACSSKYMYIMLAEIMNIKNIKCKTGVFGVLLHNINTSESILCNNL